MKIAVSGSAGIGKTTLTRLLAETLGLTYLDEGYELFFDTPGKFNQSPPRKLAQIFNQVLDYKTGREARHDAFSCDRCSIDLFNLWLARGLSQRLEDTRAFYQRCRQAVSGYDYVVLLPWGSIQLEQLPDTAARKRRAMNPWVQLHNHAAITGLACQWLAPERLIQIPVKLCDNRDRIRHVQEYIDGPAA